MLVESLARAREGPAGEHGMLVPSIHSLGLPESGRADIAVVGREEHYLDFATNGHVKPAYCNPEWVTKLGASIISYNETAPILQFSCDGWHWPVDA